MPRVLLVMLMVGISLVLRAAPPAPPPPPGLPMLARGWFLPGIEQLRRETRTRKRLCRHTGSGPGCARRHKGPFVQPTAPPTHDRSAGPPARNPIKMNLPHFPSNELPRPPVKQRAEAAPCGGGTGPRDEPSVELLHKMSFGEAAFKLSTRDVSRPNPIRILSESRQKKTN